MPISFSQRARACPDVRFELADDESVLLDLSSGAYFGLDAIGTRMWQALIEAPDLESACAVICAEYDVAPARLRADLEGLVRELVSHRLVELTGSEADEGEPGAV